MNELQGRLPHIEARKDALISAQTFEKYARLVRNMSVLGGTLGVNGRGGLEITVTPSQGGSASGYAGPFAVSASASALTVAAGCIIAGTATINFPVTTISGASGTVYLSLTYSGGAYSYSVSTGVPPQQGQTTAIYRLATVASDYAVTQIQYGDIYVAGRVV